MKKSFYFLLILVLFALENNLFSQVITFSGKNSKTSANVTIDSIRIYNLTIGKDTMLKKSTSFDLNSLVLSVDESSNNNINILPKNQVIDENNTSIKFDLHLEYNANIRIFVANSLGQVISEFDSYAKIGDHSFAFQSQDLGYGVYFIVVSNGRNSQAIKFVNLINGYGNKGNITEIAYMGDVKPIIAKPGDEFNFTGYANGYESDNLNNKTANGGENFEFLFTPKDNSKFNKNCIIPLLYQHIKDSDGSKFYANTDCVFGFEPNDSLHFYIGSDSDAVSVSGKYTVTNGKVNFIITGDYFPLNASFVIDTSLDQITMPFNVISAKNGSSTWKKVRLSPELYMQYLFKAIAIDETDKPNDIVTQRVVDWANSVKDNNPKNDIEVISLKEPSIKIIYKGGSTTKVILYQKNIIVNPISLSAGPFSSDPRTHLNVTKPKINLFDPIEKTALFIGPWDGISFPTLTLNKEKKWAPNYSKMSSKIGRFDKLDEMSKSMTDIGYDSKIIRNADAGVINLIENLLPGNGRSISPGMIYFSTHGDEDGYLSTGDFFYTDQELKDFKQELKTKYPDFLTYEGGTEDFSKVLTTYQTVYGWRVNKPIVNVLIKPMFWKWLAEKGADFSRSLVHLSACDAEKSFELKNNINAHSLFAYNHFVPEDFSAAVQRYLIKTLSRPSHSAEESFYNIKRIISTEKMIYTDDEIFNGIPLPTKANDDYAPRAWGFDGTGLVSYEKHGWYNSTNINRGNVWYLLWASRWAQDVNKGCENLIYCWDACWSKGDPGGLANQGCNNMSPGAVPFAEEVAYTGYLLKGEMILSPPTPIVRIPRFTLNDGSK